MNPNIFSIIFFFVLVLYPSFLSAFRPQNVKNIDTSFPIASDPFAIIKDANTLSNSPLNTTIVLFFTVEQLSEGIVFASGRSQTCAFWIVALIIPLSFLTSSNTFPVFLTQAFISFSNPWSVAFAIIVSPSFISEILFLTFIIGPGHWSPHASNIKTSLLINCFPTFPELPEFSFATPKFISLDCSFIAALYIVVPPFKLRTLYPIFFNNLCALYPLKPILQYTTYSLFLSNSLILSLNSCNGICNEFGILNNSFSSFVLTSNNIFPSNSFHWTCSILS